MRTNLNVHIDKQNNKQSNDYRVRLVDKDIPNMRECITKHCKTKEEAEAIELYTHRLIQFILGSK
jgi:hypothetical protein